MKILFVANVAKEHINKFHIPTIKYMKSLGWQVDVACSLDAEIPYADRCYNMSWSRSPFRVGTIVGISELRKLLKREKYDVVYCHTPVGGLVARLAAKSIRRLGTKVVYCAHGLHFYNGAPLINWLVFYPMEKLMASFTDMFITINSEDYERVKSKFNRKMVVKLIDGIGVNFERLKVSNSAHIREEYRKQLDIPNDATVLIYVAELLKNKNQSMLINTVKQLHIKGQDVYLLLVGPDHQKHGEFQKLAKEYGLSDYIRFLGWRSDIGQLMYASDICVASSIREGFGINLVEAQYCHLPVIASDNRGHRSVIHNGENGFIVNLDDYIDMSDKVITMLKDKELYRKFSMVDVSRYSSETIAKTVTRYIDELTETI